MKTDLLFIIFCQLRILLFQGVVAVSLFAFYFLSFFLSFFFSFVLSSSTSSFSVSQALLSRRVTLPTRALRVGTLGTPAWYRYSTSRDRQTTVRLRIFSCLADGCINVDPGPQSFQSVQNRKLLQFLWCRS